MTRVRLRRTSWWTERSDQGEPHDAGQAGDLAVGLQHDRVGDQRRSAGHDEAATRGGSVHQREEPEHQEQLQEQHADRQRPHAEDGQPGQRRARAGAHDAEHEHVGALSRLLAAQHRRLGGRGGHPRDDASPRPIAAPGALARLGQNEKLTLLVAHRPTTTSVLFCVPPWLRTA